MGFTRAVETVGGAMLVCVLAIAPAAAGFLEAVDAYEKGDFATAVRELQPLADSGDVEAQFYLGLAHERGRGVPQDLTQALEWYVRAANQGFARAQYKTADMYLAGRGTRGDLMLAYQWFKLAGSQRYEDAKQRRKGVAAEMTPYQIAEADMRVRMWYEAHGR